MDGKTSYSFASAPEKGLCIFFEVCLVAKAKFGRWFTDLYMLGCETMPVTFATLLPRLP